MLAKMACLGLYQEVVVVVDITVVTVAIPQPESTAAKVDRMVLAMEMLSPIPPTGRPLAPTIPIIENMQVKRARAALVI
jgi:hypothetical protein